MAAMIIVWWLVMAVFAATCAAIHFFAPGGELLGAPAWAWGLAGILGVVAGEIQATRPPQ